MESDNWRSGCRQSQWRADWFRPPHTSYERPSAMWVVPAIEAEIAARDAANARARLRVAASSVPQATFDYLASLEWIQAAENVCLVGPAGTGKSNLLIALITSEFGHLVRVACSRYERATRGSSHRSTRSTWGAPVKHRTSGRAERSRLRGYVAAAPRSRDVHRAAVRGHGRGFAFADAGRGRIVVDRRFRCAILECACVGCDVIVIAVVHPDPHQSRPRPRRRGRYRSMRRRR